MSLTILRYGDPDTNPHDRIVDNGRLFYLDMIVLSPSAAYMRKEQLERNGEIVEITTRMAPPEESMNFVPQPGFKEGGKKIHVFEIWQLVRRKLTATRSKKSASFGDMHPARKPKNKGNFGSSTKKRHEIIKEGRPCHQFLNGECGQGKRKVPCTMVSYSRCKENPVVKFQKNPPKTGSAYVSRRNARVTAVHHGRRRK